MKGFFSRALLFIKNIFKSKEVKAVATAIVTEAVKAELSNTVTEAEKAKAAAVLTTALDTLNTTAEALTEISKTIEKK